jgi:hypothetical protein
MIQRLVGSLLVGLSLSAGCSSGSTGGVGLDGGALPADGGAAEGGPDSSEPSGQSNICDSCTKTADCMAGLNCKANICKDLSSSCSVDSECKDNPYGHRCLFADGMCTTGSACRCEVNADCPTDKKCEFAVCSPL